MTGDTSLEIERIYHIKAVIVFLAIGVGLMLAGQINATLATTPLRQAAMPSPTPVMPTSNQVFLSDGSSVKIWQPSTSQETPFATLKTTQSSAEIYDYQIDAKAHVVYLIEGQPVVADGKRTHPPSSTNLLQIDINNNRKVLLVGWDYINLKLSPDADKLAIVFYENGWGSRIRLCIFDIKSNRCDTIDGSIVNPTNVLWLDNQTLIALTGGGRLYEANVSSLKGQILAGLETWYAYRFTIIPKTRTLVVAGHQRENPVFGQSDFVTYDLNTSKLLNLLINVLNMSYMQVAILEVSPDGQYLVYGEGGNYAVVGLSTSKLIIEIKDVGGVYWLPDSSAFVVTAYNPNGYTNISQFDPQTGQVKSSTKLEGHIGIIVAGTP